MRPNRPNVARDDNALSRLIALGEVVGLLAAAHVACRWFKHFTPLGQAERAAQLNFSPGWTMALFAFALLFILRRDFAAYGMILKTWPMELKQSVACAAARTRISVAGWWAAMGTALAISFAAGLRNQSPGELAGLMAWQLFATAIGEEVFFRGYVQTRLDEVFPRRWKIRRVRFGVALILTAVLFGLLHAFNTVDYFNGRFTFAWALAASTVVTGLLFGFLREATGSIVPGIVVHFLNNMLWLTLLPALTRRLLSAP